jgi:lysophospholipase L1-like esterase
MIKNFLKSLSVIFFIFLITEIIFFFYFKVNNIDEKLNNYKIKKISDKSYKFFSDLGLVLPLPNKKIVHLTKDYVDIFETKDVLNQGFGLFDDGINKNRKVFSVALGDSFTRGLGSINNLENGWVELIEQNLDWLDIINLGNLGGGIPLQKYGYDKIKHLIKHDLVIYNFYTRRGFYENLIDISPVKYIEKIKKEKNLNTEQIQEIINKLNRSTTYKPHLEYLSDKTFFKSYTLAFMLKFILLLDLNNLLPKNLLPQYITGKYEFYDEVFSEKSRLFLVPDEMYELKNNFVDSHKIIKKRKFNIFNINKDIELMNKIILHSAKMINQFYEEVELSGRDFIFVILPSKNDIYYSLYDDVIDDKDKINYKLFIDKLKNEIDEKIKVIDITDDIINFVKNNPKIEIYYSNDNHFNIKGYSLVSKSISKKLKQFYNIN